MTANISDQECVYTTISKTSNDRLHIIYQRDFYPGLAVSGDLDPVELNEIVYIDPLKSDFTYSQMGIHEEQTTSIDVSPPPIHTTFFAVTCNLFCLEASRYLIAEMQFGASLFGTGKSLPVQHPIVHNTAS